MMKRFLTRIACVLALGLLAAGCGGSGTPKVTAKDLTAFNSAAPEMKQTWEKGLAADKTNDYLNAGLAYAALLHQNLSMEQLQAVQAAMGALNERMYAAADKGDEGAKKAIEALRNASR